MNEFCVAWDYENTRYVVSTMEDMKNHNAGQALDCKPGVALVRDGLGYADAHRYAQCMTASVCARKDAA
jgi:hypothetical protein